MGVLAILIANDMVNSIDEIVGDINWA